MTQAEIEQYNLMKNKHPREFMRFLENMRRSKQRQIRDLEHDIDNLTREIKQLSRSY